MIVYVAGEALLAARREADEETAQHVSRLSRRYLRKARAQLLERAEEIPDPPAALNDPSASGLGRISRAT